MRSVFRFITFINIAALLFLSEVTMLYGLKRGYLEPGTGIFVATIILACAIALTRYMHKNL